jgi:hypothetical protein
VVTRQQLKHPSFWLSACAEELQFKDFTWESRTFMMWAKLYVIEPAVKFKEQLLDFIVNEVHIGCGNETLGTLRLVRDHENWNPYASTVTKQVYAAGVQLTLLNVHSATRLIGN